MIQQDLISEESDDSSVHGQTSWISSGLKIQEMQSVHISISSVSKSNIFLRLAIRHQIRMHGSEPASEEAQVIENKQGRLQRLIETFEYQADSHILRHRATEDALISSLGDYSEFDYVDSLDVPEVRNHIHSSFQATGRSQRSSDGSGIDNLNPEDISILLPSSLGWEWCVWHSVQSLAEKEARLRYA
jgi:hypothetical protein